MAEEKEQHVDSSRSAKRDVLRAKDIIPGDESAGQPQGDKKAEVPRFDLAENIMSEQRRLTAVRRRGPGGKTESEASKIQKSEKNGIFQSFVMEWDPVVSGIVARDIEKLCGGA